MPCQLHVQLTGMARRPSLSGNYARVYLGRPRFVAASTGLRISTPAYHVACFSETDLGIVFEQQWKGELNLALKDAYSETVSVTAVEFCGFQICNFPRFANPRPTSKSASLSSQPKTGATESCSPGHFVSLL